MDRAERLVSGKEADLEASSLPSGVQAWIDKLPADLRHILNTLTTNGHGVWLVGGCVRDVCLGLSTVETDIDLATTCHPEDVMSLFGDAAVATGIDYGTVTVKGEGTQYQITTLRTESLYRDGRHPEYVAWGDSLSEDLSRRDFTFNSMAIDAARGVLYDPFNGIEDLHRRTVRAVGDAFQRCEEDALRILRAYRFLSRDDGPLWSLDEALHQAIINQKERLKMVTVERRWMELEKILHARHAGAVFSLMLQDGVFPLVIREPSTVRHELLLVLDEPSLADLNAHQRLATMLIECSTKTVLKQLLELKTSRAFQRACALFHEQLRFLPNTSIHHLRVFDHVLSNAARAHLQVRVALEPLSPRYHDLAEQEGSGAAAALSAWEGMPQRQSPEDCLVDGHWLMHRTGMQQGMRLGRLKQWIHRLQIEHDITDTIQLEAILSRLPFEHGEHDDWPRLEFP